MREYPVERARHLVEVERFHEQARVSNLPTAAAAHEAAKLLLERPSLPRGLLLERAERSEVSVSVDDPFDRGGAESADQLVFEVADAHVEAEPFHIGARDVGAQAGALETAAEVAFLRGIAEARQFDVQTARAEEVQESSDRLRAADRHDADAVGLEIPPTARSQRFDPDLVAEPFDQHDRSQVGSCRQRL